MIDSKDLRAVGAADLVPLRFRLIVLPPLAGDEKASALAINSGGECVGSSFSHSEGMRPVRWNIDRSPKALMIPPSAENAVAHAISDIGEIVGSADISGATHPLRWDRAGSLTFLAESGDGNGWAFGINGAGEAVGDTPMTGEPRAAIWSRDGSFQILPLPENANLSEARSVSRSGHVVGDALSSGKTRAVRWMPSGDPIVLNLPPGYAESAAIGISEALDVVGTIRDTRSNDTAAYWRTNGVVTVLGTLPGDVSSTALAVNSQGWVVGRSTSPGGMHTRAFFWTEGTGLLDLASLVEDAPGELHLTSAHGVNEAGQIVCEGSSNGRTTGFVLEPVYHVEANRLSNR